MPFANIQALLLSFVVAFIFMLVGRMLTSHTPGASGSALTPLQCFTCGWGAWYLWFLVFVVAVGVSLKVAWWLFAGVGLVMVLALYRTLGAHHETEHFWTKLIFTCALFAPAFWWVSGDMPTQWDEFTHYMKNAAHLFELNSVYAAKDVALYNIHLPGYPLAATLLALPASLVSGSFMTAPFALLNVLLLLIASGGLVRLADIPVKWSNLLLVAAGAGVAVSLLNPFLDTKVLLSAYADIPLAVVLLAACYPLLSKNKLPSGISVLPTALTLVLLVGIKEIAFYFFAFIAVLWIIRSLFEHHRLGMREFFGWSLLIALPLIAHLLWNNYTLEQQFSGFYSGLGGAHINWQWLPETLMSEGVVLWKHPGAALLMLAIIFKAGAKIIAVRRLDDVVALFTRQAWLIIPALLILYYVCGLTLAYISEFGEPQAKSAQSFWRFLGHIQFVALVPLWVWAARWYKKSSWREVSYRSPWLVGLVVAALLVIAQVANEQRLNVKPIAPLAHTLQVAHSMKTTRLEWGVPVAVVDSVHSSDLYSFVMGYGLRNYAPVESVTHWVTEARGNRDVLHAALKHNNFGYLWVHAPNEQVRRLLNTSMKPSRSYLFRLNDNSFRLLASYPHPGYEQPYLK